MIFGADWVTAGSYTRLLTPMVFFSFLGSQLGWMPYIAQKQHYDFYWQAGLLVTLSGVAWIGWKVADPVIMLICQSALGSVMYVVYIYISYQLSLGTGVRSGQPREPAGVPTRETSD